MNKRCPHYSAEQWGGWSRIKAHKTHSACKPSSGDAETSKPNGAAARIAQPAHGGEAHETHSACPASPPKKPSSGDAETSKPNCAVAGIAQPAHGGEVWGGDSELPKDVGTRSIRKLPKLNGYTVFDRLGGGPYGDVYKAQFKGDSKFMAVKVQRKGKAIRTLAQH